LKPRGTIHCGRAAASADGETRFVVVEDEEDDVEDAEVVFSSMTDFVEDDGEAVDVAGASAAEDEAGCSVEVIFVRDVDSDFEEDSDRVSSTSRRCSSASNFSMGAKLLGGKDKLR
jgi:hypothetical protein